MQAGGAAVAEVSCQPITCAYDQGAFANTQDSCSSTSGACTATMQYNAAYTLACKTGYASDGATGTSSGLTVTCKDVDSTGKAQANNTDGGCVEQSCGTVADFFSGKIVPTLGADCGDTVQLGQFCEVTCPAGSKKVESDIAVLTCKGGSFVACSDSNSAACQSGPATVVCADDSKKTEKKTFVESSAKLKFGGSRARRLSLATVEANKEMILTTFKEQMASELGVSKDKVELLPESIYEDDTGAIIVDVPFRVQVTEAQSATVNDGLTSFASDPSTFQASFATALTTAATDAGVTLPELKSMAVAVPVTKTEFVEVTTTTAAPASDSNLGIILGAVAGVGIVGFLVWKFVLNKS